MPEMNQLQQLVAIAEAGTISKAAEQMHLSQPSLTRSIQKLESEWGVALFDRKKNKVTLNQTGELAVQYARQVLHDVDNMTAAVKSFERSLRTISVGSCAPGPIMALHPFLLERFSGFSIFSEEKPQEQLLTELHSKTYQLIVTDTPIEEPDILCRRYCDEQLYLTVPPAHPMAYRTSGITFSDLAGETMLLFRDIGVWSKIVQEKLSQTNFILQDHDEAFVALLEVSALPAFATNITIRYCNRRQNRVCLPILDPEACITFYCSVLSENQKYLPEEL